MTANQKIRNTSFVIEGLNSFATVLYFNYLYFFMQARFGFSDKGNLAVACWRCNESKNGKLLSEWMPGGWNKTL